MDDTSQPDRTASDAGQPDQPIDWQAERKRLVDEGDHRGTEILDSYLQTHGDRHSGFEVDILNALLNRRNARKLDAELRPCLDVLATTPTSTCEKWAKLAGWAERFSIQRDGRAVLNFGVVDGWLGPVSAESMYGDMHGERSHQLEWAESFRATSAKLVDQAIEAHLDEVPIHRLLQGMDRLLEGKEVLIADSISEVEVIVRTIAARKSHKPPQMLLHEAVKEVAGRLSNFRNLLERYEYTAQALSVLDAHAKQPKIDPEPHAPERSESWRPVVSGLQEHVENAQQLWASWIDNQGTSPASAFAVAGTQPVSCGPIARSTLHELVVSVARFIVAPLDPGAIRENEIALASPPGSTTPKLARMIARLRVAEALGSRRWWQQAELRLEQEYSRALSSAQPKPYSAPTQSEPTQSAPARKPRRVAKPKSPTTIARSARPTSEAIDQIAYGLLQELLQAAQDSNVCHVPSRQEFADALSKQIGIPLAESSLFATKEKAGSRTPRYPRFLELWRKMRTASNAARPRASRGTHIQRKPNKQDS